MRVRHVNALYKLSGDFESTSTLLNNKSGTWMNATAVAGKGDFKALPLERRRRISEQPVPG
jgi:hypothetical protein